MFAHIIPSAASASSTYYYTISANDTGVDLWADIVADNGGVAPSQSIINVTINAGVEIGAVDNTVATNYAIDVNSNFSGKTLVINNNGYIGGFGGDGGYYDAFAPSTGDNGGCGINFNSGGTVNVFNSGTIAGGGGGGGGNSGFTIEPGATFYSDGGGGAGIPAGSAGGGYPIVATNYGASDGTKTNGGLASLGVEPDEGPGGDGGNRGQAGSNAFGGANGGSAGPPYQVISGTVTVTNTGSGTVIGTPIT